MFDFQCLCCDENPSLVSLESESWGIYECWKEQLTDRYGGGTPAPSVPFSQRQYDGLDPDG
ncbi:MAG: hypothetical protein GY818_14445 [Planctomycetaceae bacterium]|nr:hypothetical protein [Planctomycetaceae bacterium]